MATGAGVVGVACPFCNTMFRDALTTASANPPKLLDIAQIAAAGLHAAGPLETAPSGRGSEQAPRQK